jgi:aminobenzoyl-glutamate transport protein
MMTAQAPGEADGRESTWSERLLRRVEVLGNKLPDPALLFVMALAITWLLSASFAGYAFQVPSRAGPQARAVVSQLSGPALTSFFADMVATFVGFHPLGVVLVALLGVGVADHSGFIRAGLKALLRSTPRALLTPMLIVAAILSHIAADAGYVLVIPLGGVIFQAAGRHPLAGIAAAFAGVSGGFSASPVPTSLDPLLQGLTQEAAQILDPARQLNPLCNWLFTGASSVLIVAVGWFLTDRVVEPRLRRVAVDGQAEDASALGTNSPEERRGLRAALLAMSLGLALLIALAAPAGSPLRSPAGALTDSTAPLMRSIVPLIFLLFLIPGLVHGFVSGRYKSSRDLVEGMSSAMSSMGYYIVMAFFASLFIYAFNKSQLGALVSVKGATFLQWLALPGPVTITGIILLCGVIDLLVGSASAKWALLAPILVPMLMQLGIAPELTQAAYRIGDSTMNIVTPLMPYFPLVVTFGQRYVKGLGIGSLVSLMLPYSLGAGHTARHSERLRLSLGQLLTASVRPRRHSLSNGTTLSLTRSGTALRTSSPMAA